MYRFLVPPILAVLVLLTVVGPAAATFPGSNEIGVFVDQVPTGEPLATDVTHASGMITLYLCLLDPKVPPDVPRQVAAWELFMSVQNGDDLFGSWNYLGGLNIGSTDDWNNLRFIVGTGAQPLLPDANGVIVLAIYQGFLGSSTRPLVFVLRGNPNSNAFGQSKQFGYAADENHLIACTAVTGGAYDPAWGAYVSNPVLIINNDGSYEPPVATEERSWGEVKTLYR